MSEAAPSLLTVIDCSTLYSQLKSDLLTILDKFVEQAALLDNFDDSWHVFMNRFAASVQHITGQELEVRAASESPSEVVEEELEALRARVEELNDERTELKAEINNKIAEVNTLKSLPLNIGVPQGKVAGKSGEVNASLSDVMRMSKRFFCFL